MRILLGLLILLSTVDAQPKPFAAWWTQFRAAVARGDAAAVARNVPFPLPWENGPVRELKSAEDFIARFNFYFTPEIKRMIAKRKPVLGGEAYTITWKARGNEYSLYFKDRGKGFALDGLSEGPP